MKRLQHFAAGIAAGTIAFFAVFGFLNLLF